VIGEGPPGSGKTIVGQQLMREARALGYEVDVLVPSVSLEKEYRDYASR
jgi:superfamily II DNA or RNA helicase